MKTAMQELIEYIEKLQVRRVNDLGIIMNMATSLLEKEKQQLQDAREEGSHYTGQMTEAYKDY